MSIYLNKAIIEFKCFGNIYSFTRQQKFIDNRLLKYEELKNKGKPIFLEIEDNFLVGFNLIDKPVFFVFGFYLNSNYKLRLIGKYLYDFLKENKVKYVTAIVHKKNYKSNRLMKKLGFVIDSEKDNKLSNTFFYVTSSENLFLIISKW